MFCPHTWTCSIGLFRCSFIAFLKVSSTVWRQAEARAMWHETLVWLKDAPQILPMDVSLWARWYISTRWAMVDLVGLAQLSYLGFYFLWTLHAFVLPSIRVCIAVYEYRREMILFCCDHCSSEDAARTKCVDNVKRERFLNVSTTTKKFTYFTKFYIFCTDCTEGLFVNFK